MIEVRRLYVTETVSSPLPVYFIAFLAHGNLNSYKQTAYCTAANRRYAIEHKLGAAARDGVTQILKHAMMLVVTYTVN